MNYAGKFDATFASEGPDTRSHAYVHVDSSQTHAPADAVIVPDAQLLFHADYSRSGSDLILSRDHHQEYVLHDYFRGEKRAALASPDGAHLTADIVKALVGEVEVSQAGTAPVASQVIGHVTKLQGSATVIRNGVSIILNMGDNVEKGDVVESGSNSTLGITFIDGTVFGLSSNARMVLNEMVYDPNGSNNSSLLSLVAGTITFVAGETAKHGDMKVDTPVATMGIRGTAVLVEIDFSVPGQNAQPNASFQVLVEPDGTTGSYILFDKTTLQPIAIVNQAGQQVNINNGIINITTNPLSPELQKLITDVFQQKFTDNTNPNTKSTAPSTDSIVPTSSPLIIKTAEALITTQTVNVTGNSTTAPPTTQSDSTHHIAGAPIVHIGNLLGVETTSFFASGELLGLTGSPLPDGAVGIVSFNDINVGDQPSVSSAFSSFTYKNAHGQNVTAGLSPLQLADIAATEVKLTIIPGANNTNIGSALFTYSIADQAFDFLAAGEQVTLTYTITVNDNYAPAPDVVNIPITITITGTNDVPVITTGPQTIAFEGGTSKPGGPLEILPTSGPPSGKLAFTDVDLTDTHTVTVNLETPVLTDSKGNVVSGFNVAPAPLAVFEAALEASIATDSTGTGNGVIDWTFVVPKNFNADIIPAGDTLTLTYDVTVADGFGGTKTQTVTVTILGTDNPAVVWIATTTPGGTTGGLWSDTANWETGTVPTATDDTIVVTNQLLGLTPAFPTTINAAAAAHSLTMNDYNIGAGTKPTVINQSTLAVGGGGVSLNSDAAIDNEGSMSVAGAFNFHDQDPTGQPAAAVTLTNTGTLVLSGGGNFTGLANVTNTGMFGLAAGTLNVAVNIANTANATVAGAVVTPDDTSAAKPITAATLLVGSAGNGSDHLGTAIADGSVLTIDGKTITFSTAQTNLTYDASGNVTVGIGTGSILTVGDVLHAIDAITGSSASSFVNAGEIVLFTGTMQALVLSGTGNVLAALGIAAGTTDYAGAIDVAGTLVLEDGGSISNASTANSVTVESVGVLTLEGTSFVAGGTVTNAGTMNLQGTSELENGTLVNSGHVYVSGLGILFDGETITSNGTITVDGAAALTLTDTTIDGNQIANGGAIDIKGAVTLKDKASLTNSASTNVETVESLASLTLNDATVSDGKIINRGTLNLQNGGAVRSGVLENGAGNIYVSGSGNALDGETVTNNTLEVVAGAVLTLDQGSAVDNSSGTVKVDSDQVDGNATLNLNNASITGGNVVNEGIIQSTGGGFINSADIDNTGTIQSTGGTLKLSSTTVTNNGTVTIDQTSELDLASASVLGGTLSNNGGTLDSLSGSNTISAAVTNAGTIEVKSGTLDLAGGVMGGGHLIVGQGATLELGGADAETVTLQGGTGTMTLQLDSTTVPFNGTITANATASGTFVVTGQGSITTSSGDALDFNSSGGTRGAPATVTLNLGGAIAGAANGVVVMQKGTGDISVTTSGGITGLGGNGLTVEVGTAQDSAIGFGNIIVDATGQVTGTGAGSAGIQVQNHNAANGGNIDVTATGGTSGDAYGIEIDSAGSGNITLEVGGTVTTGNAADSEYGILIEQQAADATGSTAITNSGTVTGAATAIVVHENTTGHVTINNSGTIGSVAGSGQAILEDGGNVSIDNTGTIDGTVNVANGTFTNETKGVWNDVGASDFGTPSGTGFTIDNAGTINLSSGATLSGTGSLTITDSGTIDNQSGSGALNGAAITVTASGTLESTGGTLTIDSHSSVTVDAGGTLEANGGNLVINGTLSGNAEIAGSSMIELGDSAAGAYSFATITFASDSTGTLKIDGGVSFLGSVSGFGANTIIDLAGVTYSSSEYDVWSNGVLSIYSGATLEAQLNFSGAYNQNDFALASDGNGGTEIVWSAAQAATVSGLDNAGNPVGGYAVTANLNDPNATGVTYTWLENGVVVGNAQSFAPTSNDIGKTLDVVIGFADGISEQITELAGTVAEAPSVSFGTAGPVSTNEDAALLLNGLSASFADAGSDTITATLSVADGTLAVAGLGSDAVSITITGTLAQIDSVLEHVTYTPNGGFVGNDTLDFSMSDAASGTTFSASGTLDITVNADHWTGATADWSAGADWSFGSAPASNIDAVVDASGAYVVTISDGDMVAAHSLTITAAGAGADIQDESGGSLTLGEALTIDAGSFSLIGGSLSASSIDVESAGHFIAEGSVSAPITNNGGIVQAYGDLSLSGTVSGTTGTFDVNGQTLTFGGSVAGGTVDFGADNNGGTLALASPSSFHAAISNFASGDAIDLTGVGYTAGEHAIWTQGSGGQGTLAIYDANNDLEASLHLNGTYTTSNFAVVSDRAAGTPGTDIHFTTPDAAAPNGNLSIDTTHFSVVESSDHTTDTIEGLQISDTNPLASTFSFSASTEEAPTSSMSPSSGSDLSLTALNSELASGITYTAGNPQPSTDMVHFTVTDNAGDSQTVNFVFNEGGQNSTLTGTTGNDVIFASGAPDTLTGNGGSDQFVFKPTSGQDAVQHTITDFNANLDTIDLRQFGNITPTANITETQQGSDTLLTLTHDANGNPLDTILLKNVQVSSLHTNDFILHT